MLKNYVFTLTKILYRVALNLERIFLKKAKHLRFLFFFFIRRITSACRHASGNAEIPIPKIAGENPKALFDLQLPLSTHLKFLRTKGSDGFSFSRLSCRGYEVQVTTRSEGPANAFAPAGDKAS